MSPTNWRRDSSPWLSQDARIAVQVFLVIGGFLAAKALAPAGKLIGNEPLALLKKRYLKLVIPYLAAVLLSIVCATIARPDRPRVDSQSADRRADAGAYRVAAEHSDFDSLSAGVWYIAIDFQLFTLLLATLWLARSTGGVAPQRFGMLLVSALAFASLLYFNRDSSWDNWALYFFGAYALGTLTYWIGETGNRPYGLPLMAVVVAAVLLIDFRSRIAVALLTALALGMARRGGFMESWPKGRVLAYLGKISYSVFLAHFPVVLVINAVFSRIAPHSPAINAFGIVFAWAASVAVGAVFYRIVESRSTYWRGLTIDPVLRTLGRGVLACRAKFKE